MMDREIVLPPEHIVELEALVRGAICGHLVTLGLGLTNQHIEFLCAPWVHFFTHSAMHRWEFHEDAVIPLHTAASALAPHPARSAPGDTLAFMEFFRTPAYRKYLDATLAGGAGDFSGRGEVNVLTDRLPGYVQTVTFTSCLPRKFRYLLQILTLGRIRDLDNRPDKRAVTTDWVARVALAQEVYQSLIPRFPQVAPWLSSRVAEMFPKSLLENLPINFRQKLKFLPRRALFSADGWQIIDDWKIYAVAQKVRHQAVWVGSPNAIGHGSLAVFWQREFEVSHLDTYLTWGWSRSAVSRAKVLPFHCPISAGLPESAPARTQRNHGVLISSAARPQHLLEFPYTPDRFERYLNTQLSLADEIQKLTLGPVSIRTRPRDLGWDLRQMVQSLNNPGVTLEFQQGKFLSRLKGSWLHICDNCSTTIIESLHANHPTLVLISGDYFQIAPDAVSDFEQLASVGIFHHDAESLLTHLSCVGGSLEAWWSARATQKAVQNFLRHQGRGGSGLMIWRRALLASAQQAVQ